MGELGFHGTQIQAWPSFLLPPPFAPTLPNIRCRAGRSCRGNGVTSNIAADLKGPSPEAVMSIWAMLFQLDVSKVWNLCKDLRVHSCAKSGTVTFTPFYLSCGRTLQGTLFFFHDTSPKAVVLLGLIPSDEQKGCGLF